MSHPIAAIDIGSNTIRVVAGEIRDERIVFLARASAQSQGVRGGFLTNKLEATVAIKKAIRLTEKQMNQQISEIYVTAGGGPLSTKIISSSVAVGHGDGHVTEVDIENAIRRSIKKSLGSNQRNVESVILGYKLDGKETVSEPIGMQGKKLDVETMLFNYASQNMDAIEDVLDGLDVSIANFFPSIVASSIVSLSAIDRKVGCILIDIGSDNTSYVVYEQDTPLHVGHLPVGSDNITQAVALEYQIPVSEAELIRQGGPLPEHIPASKIQQVIRKACTDIFKQINTDLKAIAKSANLPGGAILCGGGSLIVDIDQMARDVLKIPTRKAVVRAFKRAGDEHEHTWAPVYGTAIHAMEQERAQGTSPIFKATRFLWKNIRRFFV